MTHQEFSWWLGGALAVTPSDCSDAAKGKTLEVIRKQLVEVLVRDKAAARMVDAQGLANFNANELMCFTTQESTEPRKGRSHE